MADIHAPRIAPFRGPLADGPSPEQLDVDIPPIARFSPRELRRIVVIAAALCVFVLRRTAVTLHRPRSLLSAAAHGLVDGFERLGPTFVKLGQLMGSSPGVFPAPIADACLRCLDKVPPFSGDTALQLLEADLGRPVGDVFISFEGTPLAVASVGQVYAIVDGDFARLARAFKNIGVINNEHGTDAESGLRLRLLFGPVLDLGVAEISLGELTKLALDMAEQFDLTAPQEMILLGKQLPASSATPRPLHPPGRARPGPVPRQEHLPRGHRPRRRNRRRSTRLTKELLMRHPFLSDGWFDAIEAFRPELPEPPEEIRDLTINLTVTGAPHGDVAMHLYAGSPERGHAPDAPTTIEVPYDLARSLFVRGDTKGVLMAFLAGKLLIKGDMTKIHALQATAPTLGEPTPEQQALLAKVQAVTAA